MTRTVVHYGDEPTLTTRAGGELDERTTPLMTASAGGTQRLARLVGTGRAIEMILTGRFIDAEEALGIGLVTSVTAPDELMAAAYETAAAIAAKGPLAVRLAKLVIRSGTDADQRTGLVIERLAQAVLYGSGDKAEGTAAFLGKRTAEFAGR
ncbi:MAG: enoyl-CoA hydratase/isomerase family protein [Dietzia sp.]